MKDPYSNHNNIAYPNHTFNSNVDSGHVIRLAYPKKGYSTEIMASGTPSGVLFVVMHFRETYA
jgi:hypothetical protein